MNCANCGIQMVPGAAFCPSCGKPVSLSGSSATELSGLPSNVAGLLCYLVGFVTGILFLVFEPYKRDRFVRFHAFQAIFLSVSWVAVYLALDIFFAVLPDPLWRLGWMLSSLASLAFFLLAAFLMFKAYNREKFKLPVLGDLAEKQA